MDLLTILSTLDTTLNRRTISTRRENTVTWTNTLEFQVTYNSTNTITNCKQICLLNTDNGIKVYINHHNRHKLTSIKLSDINSFTIGAT